jgi:eukaryotic-like serine/threonine-protein kinase
MTRSSCVTPGELKAFQSGDLPESELAEVAGHLEACPQCEAAARLMDQTPDPITAAYRQSARAGLAPATPPPPTHIGQYEILGEVGRGGMGVVYQARHIRLQRIVALKMLVRGEFAEHDERARFRAEADAVARLQHPNIVQLFEVGEHEGGDGMSRPYFTLEFVEGEILSTRLGGRPQPPSQAAAWLETLARAVHYAHDQGIVHRDLKPSNVILTKDGQPKLCDFGIAKLLAGSDVKTRSGTLLGTAEYIAPEQAAGQTHIGPAADIYSLGAILYTALTGRPPFQGTRPLLTLEQVRTHEPVPPRRLVPFVPRDLDTICLKCLEKEPANRYPSALALADDLHRFLSGEPIVARPVSAWERAWKWARRRPALAGLIALSLGVVLLGFPGALVLWLRAASAFREADAARGGLESAVYAGRIALADHAYQANQVSAARALLALCVPPPGRPDLRHWEWNYLDRLCHAELGPSMVHDGPADVWIFAVGFNPNGKYLVSAAGLPGGLLAGFPLNADYFMPGSAKIWETATGQCVASLQGHPAAVRGAAFSPDGRWLATGSAEGTVLLWDSATFTKHSSIPLKSKYFFGLAFAPDSESLAIASETAITIWDMRNSRQRRVLPGQFHGSTLPLAFSPDGRRLVVGHTIHDKKSHVSIWDIQSGKELPNQLPGRVTESVALSPDGRLLALAFEGDSSVEVWDASATKLVRVISGHGNHVLAVAFCQDGRLVSAGDDRTVRLWDVGSGHELSRYRGHELGVLSLAVSADGGRLVSGDKSQSVKLWDLTHDPRGVAVHAYHGLGEYIETMSFPPDGRGLVVVAESRAEPMTHCLDLWDPATGRIQRRQTLRPYTAKDKIHRVFTMSGDGRRVAGLDWIDLTQVHVYDAIGGAEIASFRSERGGIPSVALSHDGGRLAYSAWETVSSGKEPVFHSEVHVRNISTGEGSAAPALGPLEYIGQLAFHPDGQRLLGVIRHVGRKEKGIAPAPGSRLCVWDLSRPAEPLVLGDFPEHFVTCVAFSPDGSRVAAAVNDQTLRLWDARTARPIFPPAPEPRQVTGMGFSPDGRRLATTAMDGIVRLWDVEHGTELLSLRGLGEPGAGHYGFGPRVTFSPDGNSLASNDWDGTVTIWNTSP